MDIIIDIQMAQLLFSYNWNRIGFHSNWLLYPSDDLETLYL